VKAGVLSNILCSGFIEARKLGDAGFTPGGIVSPMIALDQEHDF